MRFIDGRHNYSLEVNDWGLNKAAIIFKIYRLINWSFPEFYTFSDCGQTIFDGLICVFFSPWSAANKKFSTFLNEYTSVITIYIHKSVSLVSYSDCVQITMFLI